MRLVLLPTALDLWLMLHSCYYCKTKLTLEPMISDTETLILLCLYCHEIILLAQLVGPRPSSGPYTPTSELIPAVILQNWPAAMRTFCDCTRIAPDVEVQHLKMMAVYGPGLGNETRPEEKTNVQPNCSSDLFWNLRSVTMKPQKKNIHIDCNGFLQLLLIRAASESHGISFWTSNVQ